MAHPMTSTEAFLLAMALIFAMPYLLWRLGRTDDVAPLVVVQILCGILLGPGLLGQWFPAYYAALFRPEVTQALDAIAIWAVLLFVMLAGVELDLRQAWADRRESGIAAGCALGVPLLAGAATAAAMLWFPGWIGDAGASWQFVLGVGMACAVTALPILVLLMEKLAILRTPLGQRILRYASLDDIAVWAVLALVLMDWARVGRQLMFLLGFAIVCLGFRRLMCVVGRDDRWPLALVWLALSAFGADWAGLHYMVGAFLAGLALEAGWFEQARLDLLRQHVLLLLMPVFFLSTGLKTTWDVGGATIFAAAGTLLLAAVGGKLAGMRLAARLLRWPPGEASLIGWLLQTKALIMILFANVLLDRRIIAPATFTALLLMAVASTMLTIPAAAPRLRARQRDGASGAG